MPWRGELTNRPYVLKLDPPEFPHLVVDLWIDDVATLPLDEGLLRKLERAIEYRRGRLTGR